MPVAEINAWRQKTIQLHKKGQFIADCDGCPVLTKQNWGDNEDFRIRKITIAHFSHCNLRCNYCYTVLAPELTIKPRNTYDLLPIFRQMIEAGLLSRDAEIRFSGGEPTILGEFEELLDLVSDYGPRVRIYTNAVVRSEAILRALARRQVELVLGIDAATDEIYRKVKGRNVNRQVWANVQAYVAVDPDNCWVKMIIRRENLGDILPFVRRCQEVGARKIYYDLDANIRHYDIDPNSGNAGAVTDSDHPPDYIEALALMKYECEKRGFEAACAEAGTNSLPAELASHIELAYDELIRRDTETGERMRLLRDMEKYGVDWKFYAQIAQRFGRDFGTMVDAAVNAAP